MTRLSSPAPVLAEAAANATATAAEPAAERARLVRLCARLTGDLDAAEDLAQETLLLAHRRADQLNERAPDARWPGLAATARNLCLHWRRRRGHDLRRADPSNGGSTRGTDTLDTVPADFDLDVELERAELATLLDRAMALLPLDTRRVLVERYIEESPQAQTALRLGLTEGAVAMRLQRGKLALRRILATDLRDDAAAYGLVSPERDDWQPTRIWCPVCGRRRLMGRFGETLGDLQLECWDCLGAAGVRPLGRSRLYDGGRPELFQGVKGFKPALNRKLQDLDTAMNRWTAAGCPTARCLRCGAYAVREVCLVDIMRIHISTAYCPHCRWMFGHTSAAAIAMARPEGRRFWREHPRMASVPDQEIEAAGRPAIITRLVSLTDSAELAVVLDRETRQVLDVHGVPGSD